MHGLFLALIAQGAEIGFESPEYQAGEGVVGKFGWERVEGEGEVSQEQSALGEQSLELKDGERVKRKGTGLEEVHFREVYVLAKYEEGGEARLNLGGAWLGFRRTGSQGQVIAYSGGEGKEVGEGREVSREDGLGSEWLRITVRIDEGKGKWDVYLGEKPVRANLELGEGRGEVELRGPAEGREYYDEYREGNENPLFADADKDGMPDAEEKAHGLNAYGDDREGDLDGDGISNVEEMFGGKSPSRREGEGGVPISYIYVDNARGDDANSGRRSHGGKEGPKASLKAAMREAEKGSVIVVLKGTGIYEEGSRGEKEKELTIKAVEPVTIK